jgi:hypothetical protein
LRFANSAALGVCAKADPGAKTNAANKLAAKTAETPTAKSGFRRFIHSSS